MEVVPKDENNCVGLSSINHKLSFYCDKAPYIRYISEVDYQSKLKDLLYNEKYYKIEHFKIDPELVRYRRLLKDT